MADFEHAFIFYMYVVKNSYLYNRKNRVPPIQKNNFIFENVNVQCQLFSTQEQRYGHYIMYMYMCDRGLLAD